MLREEGLENAWKRHAENHGLLRDGLATLGMDLLVEQDYRLPQLNAVLVPDGVDEAAVRSFLLTQYNLEIGAGLGSLAGKIWRIGLMGYASNPRNVLLCVSALERALQH
jgi:alanine-glyoxylate transaminase/serine-glyoxylate transaminase/serine-pyruvate transaminase